MLKKVILGTAGIGVLITAWLLYKRNNADQAVGSSTNSAVDAAAQANDDKPDNGVLAAHGEFGSSVKHCGDGTVRYNNPGSGDNSSGGRTGPIFVSKAEKMRLERGGEEQRERREREEVTRAKTLEEEQIKAREVIVAEEAESRQALQSEEHREREEVEAKVCSEKFANSIISQMEKAETEGELSSRWIGWSYGSFGYNKASSDNRTKVSACYNGQLKRIL